MLSSPHPGMDVEEPEVPAYSSNVTGLTADILAATCFGSLRALIYLAGTTNSALAGTTEPICVKSETDS